MITISLCMIIKNEEDVLERCLSSVQNCVDEIIIVDTGSSDRSVEIAKQFTDKIFAYTWTDNFSDARNYAFSFATKDYCMWMDGDDVMLEKDQEALLSLKQNLDDNVDVVMMKYNTGFDASGNVVFSYYRERLLKREKNFQWAGYIHEAITPSGIIKYVDVAITHKKMKISDPNRNLRIFENLMQEGKILSVREQFYYARELYYHKRFEDAIQQFTLFLNSQQGWLENCIDACQIRAYCYYETGDENAALASLLESFRYDVPRAEILCDIGKHFFDRGAYLQAIYWYESALKCTRHDESGAFVQTDCYEFIPCLQLCVCYDRIGEKELACAYNERAAICKPDHEAVLRNRTYFKG